MGRRLEHLVGLDAAKVAIGLRADSSVHPDALHG